MRALVTGGAGFIGSNLVDALLERGDDVSIVDNLSTGRRENLDGALAAGARLHEASITDGEAMTALFAEERPEAVFHLAAQIDVRRAVEDPAYDAAVNVGGTAVVPSRYAEILPLAALEAMAAGLPVVAARSGGLEELVPAEGLFPAADVDALAARAQRLWGDAAAGERALAIVRKRTAPAVVARALAEAYG